MYMQRASKNTIIHCAVHFVEVLTNPGTIPEVRAVLLIGSLVSAGDKPPCILMILNTRPRR